MKKVRVGVIGMGVMGVVHASIYQGMKDQVELVGLVENSPVIRERAQRQFGVPCYATYDELIEQNIDAVSICTPDNMHFDFVMQSFAHGIKTLVEKPLEVTSERCRKIIAAMPDESYVMVGHTMRFDIRLMHMKRLLEEGKIGKVIAAKINRCNTKSVGERIGGRTSVAWFLGIHDVDILLWLLNEPITDARGYGSRVMTNYSDYFISDLRFASGAVATMENHWLLPNNRPCRMDASLKIIGEKGMLEADLTSQALSVTDDESGSSYLDCFLSPPDENGVPSGDMRRELECFVRCVRNNEVPPITAAAALQAVEAIETLEANPLF